MQDDRTPRPPVRPSPGYVPEKREHNPNWPATVGIVLVFGEILTFILLMVKL